MFAKTGEVSTKEYNDLNYNDKISLNTIFDICHIDISINQDKQTIYNILIGEYEAGNKNVLPDLKNIISSLIESNDITLQNGMDVLKSLN